MDWISNPLVVAIVAGVAANLLSPIVGSAISGAYGYAKGRVTKLSYKGLELRLQQLEEDFELVSDLKDNPARLVNLSMRAIMPVVLTTWLILAIIFYVYIAARSEVPQPLLYGLMGIVGTGTRFFVEAVIIWNTITDVRDFDSFKEANESERRKIKSLLSGRKAGD